MGCDFTNWEAAVLLKIGTHTSSLQKGNYEQRDVGMRSPAGQSAVGTYLPTQQPEP